MWACRDPDYRVNEGWGVDLRHGDRDCSSLIAQDCPEDNFRCCAKGQTHDEFAIVSTALQKREIVHNKLDIFGIRRHLSSQVRLQQEQAKVSMCKRRPEA